MSGGLAALLDDIASLARLAAASIDDVGAAAGRASAKAAGVVIDDTAVTPRYLHGFAAEREIPVVKKIALGSLRNKLLFILPGALLLSQFLPWLLQPLLMVGGLYLCFEGTEKVWEKLSGHAEAHAPAAMEGVSEEEGMVKGAIRTDFILSSEIMVIALNEVDDQPFLSRAIILIVVAFAITMLVYGVVGLIVKMDDFGLTLTMKESPARQRLGRMLVAGMPKVLSVLTVVGIAAMIWVGGHILLVGADELGWHGPYGLVHDWEHAVAHSVPVVGGLLGWLVNTAVSAFIGLVVGAIVASVIMWIHRRKGAAAGAH